MTTSALIAVGISTAMTCGICELGAGLRQRNALQSLERLAKYHPNIATLVPRVVQAATPTRALHTRQRGRRSVTGHHAP